MTPRRASSASTSHPTTNNEVEEEVTTTTTTTTTMEVHSGNTLESYVLPKSLRMHSFDVNFMTSGMEVIKVSKVGLVYHVVVFCVGVLMGMMCSRCCQRSYGICLFVCLFLLA